MRSDKCCVRRLCDLSGWKKSKVWCDNHFSVSISLQAFHFSLYLSCDSERIALSVRWIDTEKNLV